MHVVARLHWARGSCSTSLEPIMQSYCGPPLTANEKKYGYACALGSNSSTRVSGRQKKGEVGQSGAVDTDNDIGLCKRVIEIRCRRGIYDDEAASCGSAARSSSAAKQRVMDAGHPIQRRRMRWTTWFTAPRVRRPRVDTTAPLTSAGHSVRLSMVLSEKPA